MADADKPKAPPPPRIILTFDQDWPADATITHEGKVSTGMLYAAAFQLDAYAHEIRQANRAMELQAKIQAAKSPTDILAELGIALDHEHPRRPPV